jgi:membrane-bound lytic murein transglycosylase MltF
MHLKVRVVFVPVGRGDLLQALAAGKGDIAASNLTITAKRPAQGYQESQLNQSVRSRVGAIGVMQIMPATSKELGVGNIAEVEANIHAGIKYMRWMIDQYYGNEPMTNLDKALFAFASYNAGAGRISQMRKEAARRELDPNVWFHNVEYVAAEKIGAETVTYVSNFEIFRVLEITVEDQTK